MNNTFTVELYNIQLPHLHSKRHGLFDQYSHTILFMLLVGLQMDLVCLQKKKNRRGEAITKPSSNSENMDPNINQ